MYVVSREDQQQRCDNRHPDWVQHGGQAPNICKQAPEGDLELEELAVRVELDPTLTELITAVRRAAGELEGQGAKSDRIAQQLFAALATFHLKTGRL
ncbi:MAG TPA: hypothetical protein VFX94_01160 [Burkholderiales bacterium]|nr:hypothetical protein [Burkholderiales bacterium]